MNKFLIFFLLLITNQCFSQINFEKGYFITNNDEKIECLIKNLDWKNTPDSFKYKLNETSEIESITINNVKEFKVITGNRYLRKKVKIDFSSNKINDINLGYDKNPNFTEATLFLEMLVDGNFQLFAYKDDATSKYFFGQNDENIQQLIYKVYFSNSYQTSVRENTSYKSQLENLFDCASFNENQISRTEYNEKSLTSLFTKYNNCVNPENTNQKKQNTIKRDFINLYLRPRINNSSLKLSNTSVNYNFDMNQETTFGLGLEGEFVLPYNKNKWAIFIEPTYQNYKSKKTATFSNVSGGLLTADVDYKSVELPIGLRHYFFLANSSKIFINAAFVIDFNMNSKILVTRKDNSVLSDFTTSDISNIALGMGYQYRNYSLEITTQLGRNIVQAFGSWEGNYKSIAVVFGYKLF